MHHCNFIQFIAWFVVSFSYGEYQVSGFVPSSCASQSRIPTLKKPNSIHFFSTTGSNLPNDVSNTDSMSGLSYGERSRRYRRDVFNYDLWVKHRSTDRFIGNLVEMLKSGVIRTLSGELIFLTSVAILVCLYNVLGVLGYDDFQGIHHAALLPNGWPILKFPPSFFTLTSPALALLLVFKTNVSYKRWDEGRKNWGAIVNSSRTILREAAAWIHENNTLSTEQKQRLLERLEQAVWGFSRSLTRHLLSPIEDQNDYAKDVRERLRPELAEDLVNARHKPTRALYEVSCALNEFPFDDQQIISIEKSVTILCDSMGSSERIFTSPVPRFYTRHTARFLEVWLLLVPFGLFDFFGNTWNHWAMIPATTIISFFLLGIEEIGLQLEEPFSVLPQHAITNNSIGKVLTESVEWRKVDYERMMDEYYRKKDFVS